MEQRILTCIGCPLGCMVTVEKESGDVVSVTGNTCKRGEDYARKEVTSPTRIVTSTVKVIGGAAPTVSVKTKSDIHALYKVLSDSDIMQYYPSLVLILVGTLIL